jgi:hypothetical protein
LAEKCVKTTEHEGLYFEYWITFILYVLAKKNLSFWIRHYSWDILSISPPVKMNVKLCLGLIN